MTVLISILSDYLQPNFLLIKEFSGKYDQLIFITTVDMETETKQKSFVLEKALELPEKHVKRIEVIEDDYYDIKHKLEKCSFNRDDEFILNITGGTKVIPIAVCDFFKDYKSQFYYVPIGKNIVRNIYSDETITLNYRLNLKEYFTLNGLHFDADPDFLYPIEKANSVFNEYKQAKFNHYKYPNILNAQKLSNPIDRRYYAGTWFEDYCYARLKKELKLNDDAICRGAKISRLNSTQNTNDNEIDVMFILDNMLYIFECKLSMYGNNESLKDVIDKYMYKLAAIVKDYGFKPYSYILTLHNVKNDTKFSYDNVKKRLKILGITDLLDRSDFRDESKHLKLKPSKTQCDNKKQATNTIATSKEETIFQLEKPKCEVKIVGKIDIDKIK